MISIDTTHWHLERRSDGTLIVRVPSASAGTQRLPDAVFSFRVGDPQFVYWDEELRRRESPRHAG